MSGEQEPWVFRGGLTADLQVCGNAARVQAAYLLGLLSSLLYSARVERCTPVECTYFANVKSVILNLVLNKMIIA